jgi:hypothetical protein
MICFTILFWLFAASPGDNLIYNGDFELPSSENPPPGWTMWGAGRYKIPDNYTLDTTNPHSGEACFRIHHPSETAGYIVSSPELERAVREMRLPMTRFYAVGDEPFGLEGAIDRAAEVCRRAAIPQDHTVLELETQGATSKIPPEVCTAAAQMVSVPIT